MRTHTFFTGWVVFLSLVLGGAAYGRTTVPIDVNHSTVGFSVPILGGLSTVTGKFAEFEIDFKLDAKDFTRSKVKVTIQAKSISTGITQRDAHLRTRDFFSVREFPEIVFVSKEIVEEDGGHAIRGQLTMHGTTREVVFSMKSAGTLTNESSGKTTMGFKGTAIINRDDFGIDYRHQSIEAFVGNQIKINLHILTKSVEL